MLRIRLAFAEKRQQEQLPKMLLIKLVYFFQWNDESIRVKQSWTSFYSV